MKEQKISKAYAQTIIELGESAGIDTPKELTLLTESINQSNDLELLLFMDLFTIEEKSSVLDEVVKRLNLSELTINFLHFLLNEKRIGLLPLIYKDVMIVDDDKKGFLRGTIEGQEDDVSSELKEKVVNYLKNKIGKEIKLNYVKKENITAGYKVTVGDLQLDASLDNQLNKLKDSILDQ